MGEAKKDPLRVHFDRRLKLEFRGATITSDAGLLAFRELDERLGLSRMAAERLADGRLGKNIQHLIVGLFRQSVFGRLAGYEDVNDAERLRLDPAMRALLGHREAMRHRPARWPLRDPGACHRGEPESLGRPFGSVGRPGP